uniref:Ribonuclease T(2) n=1 Tax=Opuntia streptacantha TaxID=393608 RepID=A0A7C9DQ33_OPUST
MASDHYHASYFCLLWCLVLVTNVVAQGSSPAEKVSLDLYYESLCPYSANFIVNELATIFDNGLIDIVDLKLYPWGNARIRDDNSINCQHGPFECLLNTIEACAIDAWPNLNAHFPFIYCVEKLVYKGKYLQWETCFEELGLDLKPVTDCYTSGYGKELELKYAAETDSLEPPHEYVPWVVVDGQPLYEDYENFTSYICKAYKGPTPSACGDLSSANVLKQQSDRTHPVCYTEHIGKVPFLRSISSSIKSWALQVIDRAGM